jgi:hypothetical protein
MVARGLGHPSLRALSHFDPSTRSARADAGRVVACSTRMGEPRRPNPNCRADGRAPSGAGLSRASVAMRPLTRPYYPSRGDKKTNYYSELHFFLNLTYILNLIPQKA